MNLSRHITRGLPISAAQPEKRELKFTECHWQLAHQCARSGERRVSTETELVLLAVVDAKTKAFNDNTLPVGTTFSTYQVRAVRGETQSAMSTQFNIQFGPVAPPAEGESSEAAYLKGSRHKPKAHCVTPPVFLQVRRRARFWRRTTQKAKKVQLCWRRRARFLGPRAVTRTNPKWSSYAGCSFLGEPRERRTPSRVLVPSHAA